MSTVDSWYNYISLRKLICCREIWYCETWLRTVKSCRSIGTNSNRSLKKSRNKTFRQQNCSFIKLSFYFQNKQSLCFSLMRHMFLICSIGIGMPTVTSECGKINAVNVVKVARSSVVRPRPSLQSKAAVLKKCVCGVFPICMLKVSLIVVWLRE